MQQTARVEVGDVLHLAGDLVGRVRARMERPMPFTSRVVFITVDMPQLLRPAVAPAASVIAASIFV